MLNGIGIFIFMLTLLARGPAGNNDMLDVIPTEIYWHAKNITPSREQLERDAGPDAPAENVDKLVKDLGAEDFNTRAHAKALLEAMGPAIAQSLKPAAESKDPEVAAAAAEIIKTLSEHGQERAIRRLMAIRTLGEVPQKDSIPLLKKLTDSRQPFVAEYAQRAIAKLEGRALPVVNHRQEMIGDLQLLPKSTGIVFQGSDLVGTSLTLDLIADLAADQMKNGNQFQWMRPNAPMDKEKILGVITPVMLKFLEQTGNMRADGLTLGIAEDIGNRSGWVLMAFRGQYDAKALVDAIKSAPASVGPDRDDAPQVTRAGNIDVVTAGEMTFLVPSNEQLIVIEAAPGTKRPEVVDSVLKVLNGGKGDFDQNADLAALMKNVDPVASNIWAVGKLNAEMQKEPIFASVDSFTLTANQDQGVLKFTLKGSGADADKIKAAADQMNDLTQEGITGLQAQAEKLKSLQPLLEMLQSLKVASSGNAATMTGEIKPDIVKAMLVQGPLPYLLYRETQKGAMTPGGIAVPATQP